MQQATSDGLLYSFPPALEVPTKPKKRLPRDSDKPACDHEPRCQKSKRRCTFLSSGTPDTCDRCKDKCLDCTHTPRPAKVRSKEEECKPGAPASIGFGSTSQAGLAPPPPPFPASAPNYAANYYTLMCQTHAQATSSVIPEWRGKLAEASAAVTAPQPQTNGLPSEQSHSAAFELPSLHPSYVADPSSYSHHSYRRDATRIESEPAEGGGNEQMMDVTAQWERNARRVE